MKFLDDVRRWFDAGANDFDGGFALLSGASTNRFHLDNVRRRRDLASVRHELNKIYYSLGGKVKLEIRMGALPVKVVAEKAGLRTRKRISSGLRLRFPKA